MYVYIYYTGRIKYSKMSRFCRGNFFIIIIIIISAATSPVSGGVYFEIEWYAVGPPWGRHEFLKHHSVPFGFPMRWHRNAPFVRASYIRFVFVVFVYEYVCIYIICVYRMRENENEREKEREYSTCVGVRTARRLVN